MNILQPLQLLLVTLAGWLNRQQYDVIAYIQEENWIVKSKLKGKRTRFTGYCPALPSDGEAFSCGEDASYGATKRWLAIVSMQLWRSSPSCSPLRSRRQIGRRSYRFPQCVEQRLGVGEVHPPLTPLNLSVFPVVLVGDLNR